MAKIRIVDFEDAPSPIQAEPDEAPGQNVITRAVIAGERDPLHARLHTVPEGESVIWTASKPGHLTYIWEGVMEIDGVRLEAGSMALVEHGASARITAVDGPAALLVFNRASTQAAPQRAGGHVHLLPADRVPRTGKLGEMNVGAAIFADSDCPSCELWLHETSFFDPDFEVAPHFHTEDEIIVVTKGEIVLGQRRHGRGTAIAVAKDTVYGFRAGAEGLSFINFRPSRPTYATPGNKQVIDEQALYRTKLGRPPYLETD